MNNCGLGICWQEAGHDGDCAPGPGRGDNIARVAKVPMVMRSIRVPLNLWNDAKARADERDESISDVVREALERYLRSKR